MRARSGGRRRRHAAILRRRRSLIGPHRYAVDVEAAHIRILGSRAGHSERPACSADHIDFGARGSRDPQPGVVAGSAELTRPYGVAGTVVFADVSILLAL